MSSNKEQLLTILKSLREYIANEYTVSADGAKGGDSTMSVDQEVDADWQNKLEPISGGQGGEREGAASKTTSNARQGTDPYLHKAKGVVLKDDVDDEIEDDADDDVADVEETYMADHHEEEDAEDNGENDDEFIDEELMAKSADATIVNLLKDVKGLLETRHVEKQAIAGIQAEVADVKKSMSTSVEAGIKNGMKSFGFNPASGDIQRVKKSKKTATANKINGHQERIQKSAQTSEAIPAGIGTEGDSLADITTPTPEGQHEQFVDAIETILKSNESDDFRGTFKKLNSMRDQQGDMSPSTLYYHKMGGN